MHYALAKEAVNMKAPFLIVIELNDVESRRPHNGFVFLADARDVLMAPALINLNYLSDLLRLPGRQASLFVQSLLSAPSLRKSFDPVRYRNAPRDFTKEVRFIDGSVKSRSVINSKQQMDALFESRAKGLSPFYLLPKPLRPLEYRVPRYYLRKIEAAADNAQIAYAYVPAYKAPAISAALLEELGIARPIIDLGGEIAFDPAQWLDATHVNATGAAIQSERLARALAKDYPDLGAPAPCNQ